MGVPLWLLSGLGIGLFLATIAVLATGDQRTAGVPVSVRVTRIVAIIYAVFSGIGAIWAAAWTMLVSEVLVTVPVREFWPELPESVEVTGTSARVVGGGVTEAALELEGLNTATRVLLSSSEVLQGLLGVCLGVAVAVLCTGLIRRVPFTPIAVRWVRITGAATMICGLGWQLLGGWGASLAAQQALGRDGAAWNQNIFGWEGPAQILGMPSAADNWSIEFWPIGVGLALLALALVLKNGQNLQKEAAGLI